jgi:hypothetical protein
MYDGRVKSDFILFVSPTYKINYYIAFELTRYVTYKIRFLYKTRRQ